MSLRHTLIRAYITRQHLRARARATHTRNELKRLAEILGQT